MGGKKRRPEMLSKWAERRAGGVRGGRRTGEAGDGVVVGDGAPV